MTACRFSWTAGMSSSISPSPILTNQSHPNPKIFPPKTSKLLKQQCLVQNVAQELVGSRTRRQPTSSTSQANHQHDIHHNQRCNVYQNTANFGLRYASRQSHTQSSSKKARKKLIRVPKVSCRTHLFLGAWRQNKCLQKAQKYIEAQEKGRIR